MSTEEIPIRVEDAHVKLKIDPEMVNQTITAAILASGIGERVKAAAEEFLAKPDRRHYDPVASAVQAEMKEMLTKMVHEEPYRTQVREAIRKVLEEALTDKLVQEVANTFMEKVRKVR